MKIIVYSTPNCFYCHKLKEFLKEKNIKFQDIDIAKNREAAIEMVEKSGQMAVPVIDINGKIIVGFNKEEIERLLKKTK